MRLSVCLSLQSRPDVRQTQSSHKCAEKERVNDVSQNQFYQLMTGQGGRAFA